MCILCFCYRPEKLLEQDRLVKELSLAGISTIAEVNLFLEKTYLRKMNNTMVITFNKVFRLRAVIT